MLSKGLANSFLSCLKPGFCTIARSMELEKMKKVGEALKPKPFPPERCA